MPTTGATLAGLRGVEEMDRKGNRMAAGADSTEVPLAGRERSGILVDGFIVAVLTCRYWMVE